MIGEQESMNEWMNKDCRFMEILKAIIQHVAIEKSQKYKNMLRMWKAILSDIHTCKNHSGELSKNSVLFRLAKVGYSLSNKPKEFVYKNSIDAW